MKTFFNAIVLSVFFGLSAQASDATSTTVTCANGSSDKVLTIAYADKLPLFEGQRMSGTFVTVGNEFQDGFTENFECQLKYIKNDKAFACSYGGVGYSVIFEFVEKDGSIHRVNSFELSGGIYHSGSAQDFLICQP